MFFMCVCVSTCLCVCERVRHPVVIGEVIIRRRLRCDREAVQEPNDNNKEPALTRSQSTAPPPAVMTVAGMTVVIPT